MSINGVSKFTDRPEKGAGLEVLALQARTAPVVSACTAGLKSLLLTFEARLEQRHTDEIYKFATPRCNRRVC